MDKAKKRKSNQRIGTYPNEAERLILRGFSPASDTVPGSETTTGAVPEPKPSLTKSLVGWGLAAAAALAGGFAYLTNTTGVI